MTARLRRALKLVELAEGAEKTSRAQGAIAQRALDAAREDAQAAEARWVSEATKPTSVSHVSDLEEQEAYLRALRTRADAAARAVDQAVHTERLAAAEVVRTATERRKLEMWRDRLMEGERAEEARRERIASDELAARMTERGRQ